MKTPLRHLLTAALLLLPVWAQAQITSAVPGLISYQGRVLNSSGGLVGAGTPVNRTVIFRIWDHPSNTLTGNLIYSEQQTVTISEGEFSVLVGQGTGTSIQSFGYSETAKGPPTVSLPNAFGGATRYLGVTVAAGTTIQLTDNEITPRQQIVGSAFAFRAKFAESVGTNGVAAITTVDGGNVGIGVPNPTSPLQVNGTVTATSFSGSGASLSALNASNISTGTLADARLSGNVSLLGSSIDTAELTNLGVTKAKLGADVGVWDIASGNVFRSTGNVGIGFSTTPAAKLDVRGPAASTLLRLQPTSDNWFVSEMMDFAGTQRFYTGIAKNSSDFVWGTAPGDAAMGVGGAKKLFISAIGVAGQPVDSVGIVMHGNNVGIGTISPTQAKLVVNGGAPWAGSAALVGHLAPSGAFANVANGGGTISIYATNRVWAQDFTASSDERIKQVGSRSDAGSDLISMMAIEVTDYFYKDKVTKGSTPQKKVIAQQVEKVFPQAVSKQTDVVPDIFQTGDFKDGWVTLKTDLKKGERVRLTDDKTTDVFEVLEVKPGKFRTAFKPEGDKVFVYGREVKDFRTVDYDAISMLNVSATQELARKVEALEKANAEKDSALTAMTKRLAALEARDKARDAKLAAIEAMLSADKPAALPVSLKKSVGGAE